MAAKRVAIVSGGVALVVLLAVGLVQLAGRSETQSSATAGGGGGPGKLTPAQMRTRLAGSPALLAALHAQAGELLPGGSHALRLRLMALRGRPVVINKWASWCVPCRAELGAFQRASVALGREVAFIGIDSGDTSRSDSLAFLRSFPLSYPSYYDQSGQLGAAVTYSTFTPVTVIYDRRASQYIHQGPYPSQAKLEQDIRRYALDA
jgi:cytochrome c biogenesis protein CcmG, thiol:disulfide interchange protein DsbE